VRPGPACRACLPRLPARPASAWGLHLSEARKGGWAARAPG
jgi:hypothetical protein